MIEETVYLSEEHRALRDQVRRFVDNEIRPHAEAWEEAGSTPRAVLTKLGELGLLGIRYPAEFGGSEMDTLATVVFAEELAKSTFGGVTITILVHTDMASPHLFNAGTPEQKAEWMPKIVTGEKLTAIAVTEPDAGSDVAGMKTKAIKDGDHWVLNGSKMFITNGVNADVVFVAARTDPEAKGSRGVTMFMVERDMEGFSVGRNLKKSGWWSSDTAELVFNNVRVPDANVLGGVNRGFYAIMQNFQNERLAVSAQAIGEAQAAIDLTLTHLRDRKAFGGVLWDKQAIRQRMAMRQTEVAAARQLLYHAAWLDTQGHDAVKEVSMVKVLCGELVQKVVYDCQQFHGGMGYIRETAIERLGRDVRVEAIGGGATEVMLEEVAKRM